MDHEGWMKPELSPGSHRWRELRIGKETETDMSLVPLRSVRRMRFGPCCTLFYILPFFPTEVPGLGCLFLVFIYFWLSWVSLAARELSLVSVCGLLIMTAPLVAERGLRTRASAVAARGLQSKSSAAVVHRLAASQHVGGIFKDQGSNSCPLHCQVDS